MVRFGLHSQRLAFHTQRAVGPLDEKMRFAIFIYVDDQIKSPRPRSNGTDTAKEDDLPMNGSERDDFNQMIRRYEEDMRRYVKQNPSPNAGTQYTGNMPSCGSEASPVNTGINTGGPVNVKRFPDATPPMKIPDASSPIEAAGNSKNHADNRATASRAVTPAPTPIPEAAPPIPMDEQPLQTGGRESSLPSEDSSFAFDGRRPLYPIESREPAPTGDGVSTPFSMPASQQGGFSQNQQSNPPSESIRKDAVPLPLAVGNVGIRPAIPAEQSPWGPTSAEPPAQPDTSNIPAQTQAPQYADLTATTANTPTSQPLVRQPSSMGTEPSLREQNIANASLGNNGNVRNMSMAQNMPTAPPDAFTSPSVLRSGNAPDDMVETSQLLQDLEKASRLMTDEQALRQPATPQNVQSPMQTQTNRMPSAETAGIEAPRTGTVGDIPNVYPSGQLMPQSQTAPMEALSPPLPSDEQQSDSNIVVRKSSIQPNGVYQTESDYPVREQEEWESDEATLTIYAYTARQGLPVPNADVTISRVFEGRPVLHFFTSTGVSGETVPRAIPAPPREWTQTPGHEHPYASYSIQVDAPGYYTSENINVPVFGGEASIQPVEMIPIPENENFIRQKLVRESGPADL